MIVVDVNVIAYLWIPGEMTDLAERVLAKDPEWSSVFLWRSEFRNILSGYLRCGDLKLEAAMRCLEAAESQLSGYEFIVPSSLVMSLVADSTCTAYDCEYVALAQDLGTTLVTADRLIFEQFPNQATSPGDFVA